MKWTILLVLLRYEVSSYAARSVVLNNSQSNFPSSLHKLCIVFQISDHFSELKEQNPKNIFVDFVCIVSGKHRLFWVIDQHISRAFPVNSSQA